MSRGPGTVERLIEAAFVAHPTKTFSVKELVALRYPSINRIEKKHRVTVVRAAKKTAARTWWAYMDAAIPGHQLIFYNSLDLHSYGVARLRACPWEGGKETVWLDQGMGVAKRDRFTVEQIEEQLESKPSIAKLLEPGEIWWREVELARAKHEDRQEEAQAIEQAIAADRAAFRASMIAFGQAWKQARGR